MGSHIYQCQECKRYTLTREHCGKKTVIPKPPKFSLTDKYGKYRRDIKKRELIKRNLY